MSKKYKKPIICGIVVLAIVLIISALSNSTYALFSSDSYGANTNLYSTGMLAIETKSKSENILLTNALPITDEEGLQSNPYVFTIKNVGNLDYLFDVKLLSVGSSNTLFSSNYIKLQIDDGDVTTLSALTNGVIKSNITLLAGETIDISIRVWLSIDTPNSEIGKSFNSKIVTDGQAVYTESNNQYNVSLVNHISNLYNNSDRTEVDAADGITYNYARDVSLMNDRLASSGKGIDDGNIRYYGVTPNNYIDIGDIYEEDVTENGIERKKGEPILYRIIGLFKDVELENGTKKDLIKVIRNDSIGQYSWDSSVENINNGYGINEWSQADIMKLLNPEHEEEVIGGSLYWNSQSGKCYRFSKDSSVDCDFSSTGLSDIAKSKIQPVKWNVGGWYSSSNYASALYGYERGNKTIQNPADGIERTTLWPGNVALAYPSDYGYAADLDSCSDNLYNYENCISTNWLYQSITNSGGVVGTLNSWLLTPRSDMAYFAWYVFPSGRVWFYNNLTMSNGVSPVFYLDSELLIESGTGKSNDPYVVR